MQIKGTYDALLVPLLLPLHELNQTLPTEIRNLDPSPFIAFTASQCASLGLDPTAYDPSTHHPVMFELGHQTNTGPPPFGLTFAEAKLQILGLRYPPSRTSGPAQHTVLDDAERGYVYKQLILFKSLLLYGSSNLLAGLRAKLVTISPDRSPSAYPPESEAEVRYNVKDHVEASFTRQQGGDPTHRDTLTRWAGTPWYGVKTATDTLTKFNFNATSQPFEPVFYRGTVRVRLASFYDPSAPLAEVQGPDWVDFTDVTAWRVKRSFVSEDLKVSQLQA